MARTLNRRGFLKGLLGTAAALALPTSGLVLPAAERLIVPERRLWPLDRTMLAPSDSVPARKWDDITCSFDVQQDWIRVERARGGVMSVPGLRTAKFTLEGDMQRLLRVMPNLQVGATIPLGEITGESRVATGLVLDIAFSGSSRMTVQGVAL